MKRLISAAALVLVLGSGAALAQPTGYDGPGARGYGHAERGAHHRGHGGRGMRGLMLLQVADLNGDNTVTRTELEQLQTEAFSYRDRNGDGFLDQADASPARQRMMALREARADAREERPRREGGRNRGREERMEAFDADEDGRISRVEFLARPQGMFDRLDANSDGSITPDELDAHLQERADRRDERRARWWRD